MPRLAATAERWSVGAPRFGEPAGTTRLITGTAATIQSITRTGELTVTDPGTTLTPGYMGRPAGSMGRTAAQVSARGITRAPELTRAERLPMVHTERAALPRHTTHEPEPMRKRGKAQACTATGAQLRSNAAMIGPARNALPTVPATPLAPPAAAKAELWLIVAAKALSASKATTSTPDATATPIVAIKTATGTSGTTANGTACKSPKARIPFATA